MIELIVTLSSGGSTMTLRLGPYAEELLSEREAEIRTACEGSFEFFFGVEPETGAMMYVPVSEDPAIMPE